eukprot:TRINITY_DN6207_c0_g1_i1.p1 TRINITY_DN6207_c0_g1~~TRINITY_DN6207_c0_g1_i1.p1  ORF type:complete len:485 (+),score=94.85 TRINITY_DN6207_c0_g1_i1:1875-3329(+)
MSWTTNLIFLSILFIVYESRGAPAYNTNINIVTTTEKPFMYFNEKYTGNNRFTGFTKNLLDQIFSDLNDKGHNLTYTLYISPGNKYGGLVNGSWNGMVGELINGNADVAFADFTVTSARNEVIDWSIPYLDIGLTILVLKPVETPDVWAFLQPFSVRLWICYFALTIVMALAIYISDRLSPYGYHQSKKRSEPEKWDFSESLFLSLLIFVGKDADPGRSWGGRTMVLAYYAFSCIIIASYTANLTATLTVKRATVNVNGLDDLRKPNTRFGVIGSSSIQSFFELPSNSLFRSHMVLFNSLDEGITALTNEEIDAFVHDNVILEYVENQQPCNLFAVGKLFYKSNYGLGFGLNQSTQLNKAISSSILSLRESGYLESLYDQWWNAGACSLSDTELSSDQLDITELSGVFALVGIIALIGVCILIFENIFYRWYKPQKHSAHGCFHHVDKFLGHEESGDDISNKLDQILNLLGNKSARPSSDEMVS